MTSDLVEMTMRGLLISLATLVVMVGCTTYTVETKRDESYTKTLTEVSVRWMEPEKLPIRIWRGQPGGLAVISDLDRANSHRAVGDLLELFRRGTREQLPKLLEAQKVSVVPDLPTQSAATTLRVRAAEALTECAPLGGQSSLYVICDLIDHQMRKVVWSGTYKIGAPFPEKSDDSTYLNFANSLIGNLKRAGLIK